MLVIYHYMNNVSRHIRYIITVKPEAVNYEHRHYTSNRPNTLRLNNVEIGEATILRAVVHQTGFFST